MATQNENDFKRTMLLLCVASVIAWVAFALFFRSFWPGAHEPGADLTTFWSWLVVSIVVFVPMTFGLFRLVRLPPAWRAAGAAAVSGPALCLDVLTTTYFEVWFPNPGSGDDRIYPALIVGGVGMILLAGIFTTKPREA